MALYNIKNEKEIIEFGKILGKNLVPGMVVCLVGDLGAGKTTLTKGIANGFGIKELVTSPTFTIINQYEGEHRLYHIDTYRIESLDEMVEIGVEDYLPAKDGVTVVEWPGLIEELLPKERIILDLRTQENDAREITIQILGDDKAYQKLLQELNIYASAGN